MSEKQGFGHEDINFEVSETRAAVEHAIKYLSMGETTQRLDSFFGGTEAVHNAIELLKRLSDLPNYSDIVALVGSGGPLNIEAGAENRIRCELERNGSVSVTLYDRPIDPKEDPHTRSYAFVQANASSELIDWTIGGHQYNKDVGHCYFGIKLGLGYPEISASFSGRGENWDIDKTLKLKPRMRMPDGKVL